MKIKYDDRLIIDFEDYENINVILGDSGIGRTKLVRDLKNLITSYQTGGNVESDYPIEDIVILEDGDILRGDYTRFKRKMIFIDNFDRKANDKLMKFIRTSENCFYLIGRDRVFELGSLISFNILLYDGNTYRLVNKYYDRVEFNKLYKTQV